MTEGQEAGHSKGVGGKVKKYLPILTWLPHYDWKDIRFDLIAGIAVAGLIIPESMGIAGVAGVEPQHGLYAILIALFLYAIFGSGRRSVVSTPSALALLTATAITALALTAYEDILSAVVTITFLTGLMLLIMAVLRLGVLANFISYPVMKGFLFGLALTIIIGQVPKLLGVEKGSGNFFEQLWHIIGELGQASLLTIGLSIIAVIILFVLEVRFKKIPAVLLLFVVGLAAAYLLDWESMGIALVGTIPAGLPSFSIPVLDPEVIYLVIPTAIGIAFVCFSESVAIGDEVAEKHNDEIDPNQELVAVAATNLGSSFVQGIGTGVSMSASHVGNNSGSRSQMTLIVAGLMVLATLLFLTGVFYYIPEFILGVIVIFAVKGALKVRLMIKYYHIQRLDFYFAILAILGVLVFEVLVGLLLAIIFAMGLLIWRVGHQRGCLLGRMPDGKFKDLSLNPDAKEVEGVKILRLNTVIFYANAPGIKARLLSLLRASPKPKLLIIDMETHTQILDITSGRALEKVILEAKERGVRVAFVGVHTLAMRDMEKQGIVELAGKDRFKDTIEDALSDLNG
ncbi:MAG: SulP family inorganic anion transporter, partial [Methanomassiliicoccales archaeon]|nr:SulP family inorganic anion transporter [Methanomassiliicoccales archaeon]